MSDWTFRLIAIPPDHAPVQVCIDMTDALYDLETPKPDPFMDNFGSAVKKMKARGERRARVRHIADALAKRLADTLEDLEGWNGEERAEKTLLSISRAMKMGEFRRDPYTTEDRSK
jgi:hypothetical protein